MRTLFICFMLCLCGLTASSQSWTPANGIVNKIVRTLVVYSGDTLLAGVDNEGIYISFDNGLNWQQHALMGQSVHSIFRLGNDLYAGTYGDDIFKSTLYGATWNRIFIDNLVVEKISMHNGVMYAATHGTTGPGGLYTSADTGATWYRYGNIPPYAYLDYDFNAQGRVFVATSSGAYYSDNQSPWAQTSILGSTVRTVKHLGGNSLIYGDDMGIFTSSNNGASATQVQGIGPGIVFYVDSSFYVGTHGFGLYYNPQIGPNWTNMHLNEFVLALIESNGQLLAGTDKGVFLQGDIFIGLDEAGAAPKHELYPNPAKDRLYVKSSGGEVQRIEIFDVAGRLEMVLGDVQQIDISGMAAGVYFYRIYSQDGLFHTGKLVKQE